MGKRLAMRPPPWDKGAAEAEPGSFGHWLRRQRELREISLRDIAERTKISLRYLEAMEEDRFDLLPAPVFARGFLREYARYVGLSPDEVVNHWLSVQPAAEGERAADPSSSGRSLHSTHAEQTARAADARRAWIARALLVLGILAALALAGWLIYYTLGHRRGAGAKDPSRLGRDRAALLPPSAPPAAAVPIPGARRGAPGSLPTGPQHAAAPTAAETAATAATATAEPAPLEVTLDFTRDCWVEAVIDGKKWMSEERVPGEALQLQAQQKVVLTLGNPGSVEAQVNGYTFDLPHGRQPIHDLVIDLDTLRALKSKHEAL